MMAVKQVVEWKTELMAVGQLTEMRLEVEVKQFFVLLYLSCT